MKRNELIEIAGNMWAVWSVDNAHQPTPEEADACVKRAALLLDAVDRHFD